MAVLGQAHRAIMDIGAGHNFAPAASFLRSKTAGGAQNGNPHLQKFSCMYLTALLKIVIPSPSCLFFRRDQCGC